MITIRRLTFDLPDNGDAFMTHLRLDTEKVKFGLVDVFVGWPIEMYKPWIGEVKGGEFRIIRSRVGLFKLSFSKILLAGQINNEGKEGKIEVRLGLPGYRIAIILSFWAIVAFALLTNPHFQDKWGSLIAALFLIFPILETLIDMYRTESKFVDYWESVKATSHNTVHMQ